tara:strand:- start:239 stop:550 length:312 start_codon:yes stop_codon:yes gene_type:complete
MAVNDELGQLRRALDSAVDMLGPGGRLCVITFHSLEDRIVKQAFRSLAGEGGPKDAYGHPLVAPRFRLINRRGIAGKKADAGHPRSRSARLRTLERIPPDTPQ